MSRCRVFFTDPFPSPPFPSSPFYLPCLPLASSFHHQSHPHPRPPLSLSPSLHIFYPPSLFFRGCRRQGPKRAEGKRKRKRERRTERGVEGRIGKTRGKCGEKKREGMRRGGRGRVTPGRRRDNVCAGVYVRGGWDYVGGRRTKREFESGDEKSFRARNRAFADYYHYISRNLGANLANLGREEKEEWWGGCWSPGWRLRDNGVYGEDNADDTGPAGY